MEKVTLNLLGVGGMEGTKYEFNNILICEGNFYLPPYKY